MPRKLLTSVVVLALAANFAGLPALRADPPAPAKKPTPRLGPEDRSATQVENWTRMLFDLLNREIEPPLKVEPGTQMSLQQALGLASEYGTSGRIPGTVPILVNLGAFKAERPDDTDVTKLLIKMPFAPKQMTLGNFLRLILAQLPERNATFIIRRGVLEITTYSDASLKGLLSQPVALRFEGRPLDEAVRDLANYSGASIVVDARAGDKLKTPVTATFLNDTSVWSALYLLADTAELKAVVMEDGVYVTTPERAQALQKEQQRRRDQIRKEALPAFPGLEETPLLPRFSRPQPRQEGA